VSSRSEQLVQPIDIALQSRVRETTHAFISRAGRLFERRFIEIPILFDLKGRAAGMYRVRGRERVIRYNPWLFARYFDDNLNNTVPHEVAHYVCDVLYGIKRIKPHGPEWRELMTALGATPKVTGRYDLAGIPTRQQQRHSYRCDCTTHLVSSVRHKRMLSGQTRYYCRYCKSPLQRE
jgi:SprT protein